MERRDPVGRLDRLLEDERLNAVISWLLVGFVALVAVASFLRGQLLWGIFTAVVVGLALVPAAAYRDPSVMLPWEVLLVAALPVLVRAIPAAPVPAEIATHLSVAALALVVAVELHVFTPVRMNAWFAVLFVVVATMATAGVWAVVQWLSDLYLGTDFVLDPTLSAAEQEAEVMWDFVAATLGGLLAGLLFDGYFRRLSRVETRLPVEVEEVEG